MEDTEEQRSIRERQNANLKPFQPGVSGNPGGRPKGRSITAEIRRLIEEGMDGHDIAKALAKTGITQALKGDHRFWQSVLERTEGKVADKLDTDGSIKIVIEYADKKNDGSND